ncbi:hypothetical protein BDK51DRAFT_28246 [Blyttiomyces helicus]|uniref:Uncharacterized protein n=1 Tax=Blyttiomyces helicus TaxID=388810 RepID=A0A4P9WIL4_9FUNG|nr:hypothetical protein BDK51DRAFT_28246 [Blyttiomyces helicus]|eukprot:RKO92262.1 hypothetical protein BDK51DRAFT_28246 [Blyttiomyces helicus]
MGKYKQRNKGKKPTKGNSPNSSPPGSPTRPAAVRIFKPESPVRASVQRNSNALRTNGSAVKEIKNMSAELKEELPREAAQELVQNGNAIKLFAEEDPDHEVNGALSSIGSSTGSSIGESDHDRSSSPDTSHVPENAADCAEPVEGVAAAAEATESFVPPVLDEAPASVEEAVVEAEPPTPAPGKPTMAAVPLTIENEEDELEKEQLSQFAVTLADQLAAGPKEDDPVELQQQEQFQAAAASFSGTGAAAAPASPSAADAERSAITAVPTPAGSWASKIIDMSTPTLRSVATLVRPAAKVYQSHTVVRTAANATAALWAVPVLLFTWPIVGAGVVGYKMSTDEVKEQLRAVAAMVSDEVSGGAAAKVPDGPKSDAEVEAKVVLA